MSSPNPNQIPPAHPGWSNQNYKQPYAPIPSTHRFSQVYPQNQPYFAPYPAQPVPYVQPHYGNTTPAPIIAELPAPLPPAPPTTTPNDQLKEDELLAHRLQNLEVEEVRRRSSSNVSQTQRPGSMVAPSPQTHAPLLHQVSSLSLQPLSTNESLRPRSMTESSNCMPWSPGSFGMGTNSLPEVVPQSRSVSYVGDPAENFPIPVESEQQHTSPPPIVISDPIALSAYLEEYRQVPYPPTWSLPPVLATFYACGGSKTAPKSDWLSQQDTLTWRTIRPTEPAYNPAAPSYTFMFTAKGGSFRDPRFQWTLIGPESSTDPKKAPKNKDSVWTYDLRLDLNGGMRKSEVLGHGKKKAVLTTYVHALNYDSLRFIGPDGRSYLWVSSAKVSSVNGSRYDTIRHALFGAVGHNLDPLYGEIVADHTFWDGYVDQDETHTGAKCDGCQSTPINGLRWKCKTCHHHDVCENCRQLILSGGFGAEMQQSCDLSLVCLPDEALYIRSPAVDPTLVVATLQIIKDWERQTLRDERMKNPIGFKASEEAARKQDLGIMSYWQASDWDKKSTAHEKMGTIVKAKSKMEASDRTTSALGGLVGAGSALAVPAKQRLS
ncbi:hypothetical protein FB567DRAFT_629479 [Paraphoma chrysanthemicola]|uniref:ZZ-type domain-containing protein n=1 Tax=Paraphoma chrysanthemicola TaxID=798071 RepID=A0A8K0R3U1_9PLEO|nr:hypothetical protein FB567DRAFT_629479 [Paraphoma chrysanthemicola]